MKPNSWLICVLLAGVFFLVQSLPSNAQTAEDSRNTSSQRWFSHQMHQPPPDDNPRNKLSRKRINDIRQLYLQAKKELEAKKTKNTATQ
ncbi:hypothetical protein ACFL2Q_05290 [Thermodesulfobacteriota bacterium]